MRAEPSRKTWRRQLRVRVRAVMILVLALGAWLGRITHCARIQRAAAAAITRSGGHVFYDGKWLDAVQGECDGLLRPKWLVNVIGIDYLSQVTDVSLDHHATDTDLIQIGRLTRLERLSISSSSITDAGLRHLRRLGALRQLFLHSTPISDGGSAHVNCLSRLQLLTLVDTKVTDAGLRHLRGLLCLQELDVPIEISESAIQGLQCDLPSVKIHRGLPYKCR